MIEHFHLNKISEFSRGRAGRELSLPNGINVTIEREHVKLARKTELNLRPEKLSGIHALLIPGTSKIPLANSPLDNQVGIWSILAELMAPPLSAQKDRFVAELDYDAMGSSISIRTRQPGDRFQPLGVQSYNRGKKLQDFFVNVGIPRGQRDQVPVVVTSKGIAWVIGWRIAHWARVTPKTKSILRLEFSNGI